MAESYSVKAVLSAVDRGFSSTLKGCSSALDRIDKKISGFSFGILAGAGQAAFNVVTNGVTNLIGEIDDSNAAWKTFEKNMEIVEKSGGKLEKSTADVKKELQEFAQQTVYSSSDMASTYAQLAAVGTKNTTKLVKGFGGLAAAAENPQQAMKTLSQQATQMAAKPKVAWADFKLMLEQTPAGIAAVAKHMGMTTAELVTAVQDGEVSTAKFFDAIQAVGTSDSFTKLATEAKTMGQAMDGLKETVGNKLTPAFDVLNKAGIKAINAIADKLANIDSGKIVAVVEKIVKVIQQTVTKIKKYWNVAVEAFSGVGTALGEAFGAVKSSMAELNGEFGSTEHVGKFKTVMETVADAIKKVAEFVTAHSDTIAKLINMLPMLVIGLKGFKVAKVVAPFLMTFGKGLGTIASKVVGGLAGKLLGVASGQKAVGEASKTSGTSMISSAKAYALMGVAVLAIAVSFALLAQSAIALSNSGGLAIGVMAGLVVGVAALGLGMALLLKWLAPMGAQLMPAATAMLALGAAVVLVAAGFAILTAVAINLSNAGGLAIGIMVGLVAAVALLAVGAAALGPALTAGSVGFLAFGAAIVMVGAGAVLAAAALAIVASVLPAICEYGLQGSVAILALGGGMAVFAVGAAAAGVACVALGAGLAVVGAAVLVVAAGVIVLAAGVITLAAGVTLLAASLTLVGAALALVAMTLPTVSTGALLVTAAFTALLAMSTLVSASLLLVDASLIALAISVAAGAVALGAFDLVLIASAASTLLLEAALVAVSSTMKTIAKNATKTEKALKSMEESVSVVESGLNALGSKAKDVLKSLTDAFDNSAKEAKSAGKSVGDNFADSMKGGLKNAVNNAKDTNNQLKGAFSDGAKQAKTSGKETGNGYSQGLLGGLTASVSAARSAVSSVTSALRSGYGGAYSAGAYISQGFANGMWSQVGSIRAAAAEMAAAAEAAIRAKAKIHSPSRVAEGLGEYYGEGYVGGILGMVKDAWKAAQELVSVPQIATPKLATAYGFEMSSDYDYSQNHDYTIEVPLSVDGKEFARATASYTQSELNRQQTRENRKKGKV